MSVADRDLNFLNQILRILRADKTSAAHQVELLYDHLFEGDRLRGKVFSLSSLESWDAEQLDRALTFAEDIIALYAQAYYDARVIPVTYYKRERRVRRHLDQQFSRIFKELILRSGREPVAELITEEPIYFLNQQARERRFPKSRDGRASLSTLKARFHLALSHRLVS